MYLIDYLLNFEKFLNPVWSVKPNSEQDLKFCIFIIAWLYLFNVIDF